jgi:hypothetical protein
MMRCAFSSLSLSLSVSVSLSVSLCLCLSIRLCLFVCLFDSRTCGQAQACHISHDDDVYFLSFLLSLSFSLSLCVCVCLSLCFSPLNPRSLICSALLCSALLCSALYLPLLTSLSLALFPLTQIAALLHELSRFQSTPYPYETDPDVRDVLLSVRFKEDLLKLIEDNHYR